MEEEKPLKYLVKHNIMRKELVGILCGAVLSLMNSNNIIPIRRSN